ncbi:hypothetical protein EXE53_05815 [Halorubrum sp. SD626R]|nr:hypothetical protein EXE53_05815 [Halorubrum sp. SD626R]
MAGWECPTKPREGSGLDPEAVHRRFPSHLMSSLSFCSVVERLNVTSRSARLGLIAKGHMKDCFLPVEQ